MLSKSAFSQRQKEPHPHHIYSVFFPKLPRQPTPIFAASLTAAKFTSEQFAGFTCRDTQCRDRFVVGFLDVCLVLVRPFQKLLFYRFRSWMHHRERKRKERLSHSTQSPRGRISGLPVFGMPWSTLLGGHGKKKSAATPKKPWQPALQWAAPNSW